VPVNKFFPAINLILVLIIIALGTMSVRIWTNPHYPPQVDGTAVVPSPKTLKNIEVTKPNYNAKTVSQVVQTNIFRKERREYVPPVTSIRPNAPSAIEPALPPPNLVLKGILIMGGTKIAILQGSYWLNKADKPVQRKIKKKGYSIGQIVGNFELKKIDKSSVTLDDKKGQVVRLRLTNRSLEKAIQGAGTTLFQEKKKNDPIKTSTTAAPSRISGTRTFLTPAPEKATSHISGR
jgi:hypothetical protein